MVPDTCHGAAAVTTPDNILRAAGLLTLGEDSSVEAVETALQGTTS